MIVGPHVVFTGTADNPYDMVWAVDYDEELGWAVLERYPPSMQWICNCILESEAECRRFIQAWMDDNMPE